MASPDEHEARATMAALAGVEYHATDHCIRNARGKLAVVCAVCDKVVEGPHLVTHNQSRGAFAAFIYHPGCYGG